MADERGQKWPTHGHAVDALNEAAEGVNDIEAESALLMELAGTGKLTREELLYRLGRINRGANHVTRTLERQGARTRPRV